MQKKPAHPSRTFSVPLKEELISYLNVFDDWTNLNIFSYNFFILPSTFGILIRQLKSVTHAGSFFIDLPSINNDSITTRVSFCYFNNNAMILFSFAYIC